MPKLLCDRGDFAGRLRPQLLSPIESEESALGISRLNDEDWNIAKLLRLGGDMLAALPPTARPAITGICQPSIRLFSREVSERIGSSRCPGISHIRKFRGQRTPGLQGSLHVTRDEPIKNYVFVR